MTDDNEWEDVLGNGDLMRKVVRKGNGERPTAGQLVKISSKPIHAEESERKELQLILGHGFFIDGNFSCESNVIL
jgi:hypothetical protein